MRAKVGLLGYGLKFGLFTRNWMKLPDLHWRVIFPNPPPPGGGVAVNYLQRNLMFANPPSHGGQVGCTQSPKIFLLWIEWNFKIFIKRPSFPNLHPSEWGSELQKQKICRNWMNFPDLHRSHVYQPVISMWMEVGDLSVMIWKFLSIPSKKKDFWCMKELLQMTVHKVRVPGTRPISSQWRVKAVRSM